MGYTFAKGKRHVPQWVEESGEEQGVLDVAGSVWVRCWCIQLNLNLNGSVKQATSIAIPQSFSKPTSIPIPQSFQAPA